MPTTSHSTSRADQSFLGSTQSARQHLKPPRPAEPEQELLVVRAMHAGVDRPLPANYPAGHDPDRASALEYELARLPRDVTTALTFYMEEEGISQRELAKRMKITPGRVSQILSGDENLTLRTLAAVCVGLAAHFQVDLVPNRAQNGDRGPSERTQNGMRAE